MAHGFSNRVWAETATTGTGDVTIGAAKPAHCTPAQAGTQDGDERTWVLEEGNDFEIFRGAYTSSGAVVTRGSVLLSLIAGSEGTSRMDLQGSATIREVAAAEDLLSIVNPADARAALGLSDTLPTTQVFTSSSGTYTTPAGCKWIEIEMVGGGGGGGGAGSSPGNGGAGGNTTFGSLTANGGAGATNAAGGNGGAASGGFINDTGSRGQNASGVARTAGGNGGLSTLGRAGWGGAPGGGAGVAAAANSGSGGGGGGCHDTPNGGGGGGGGGYVRAIINNPSATYSYAVGAGGTAGTAGGGSGGAGAAGGSGIIIVTEHYN